MEVSTRRSHSVKCEIKEKQDMSRVLKEKRTKDNVPETLGTSKDCGWVTVFFPLFKHITSLFFQLKTILSSIVSLFVYRIYNQRASSVTKQFAVGYLNSARIYRQIIIHTYKYIYKYKSKTFIKKIYLTCQIFYHKTHPI